MANNKTKSVKKVTKKVVKVVTKNDDKMVLYALIVLVLAVVLFWAIKKGAMEGYGPKVTQNVVVNSYPTMSENSDLDKAIQDLDANEVSTIDKELSGMDTDSSNF